MGEIGIIKRISADGSIQPQTIMSLLSIGLTSLLSISVFSFSAGENYPPPILVPSKITVSSLPLRVTKEMTIISGHQRVRAAIKAECTSVHVIIDESNDDDDVLIKRIVTSFGRRKNDAIKQAKWIEEYKQLKDIRHGGHRAKGQFVPLKDIANQLGVDERTVKRLTFLLKLDPALQQYISDGKITPTTGFTLLTKLSPEEQQKLIDMLPDDVKLSLQFLINSMANISIYMV